MIEGWENGWEMEEGAGCVMLGGAYLFFLHNLMGNFFFCRSHGPQATMWLRPWSLYIYIYIYIYIYACMYLNLNLNLSLIIDQRWNRLLIKEEHTWRRHVSTTWIMISIYNVSGYVHTYASKRSCFCLVWLPLYPRVK